MNELNYESLIRLRGLSGRGHGKTVLISIKRRATYQNIEKCLNNRGILCGFVFVLNYNSKLNNSFSKFYSDVMIIKPHKRILFPIRIRIQRKER